MVEVDSHGAQKERIRAKSDVGLPVRARKIPLSPAAGVSGGVSGGITGSTLTEGTVIGDNQGESSLNPIHPIMEGDDERTESVDEASAGALRRDRTSVGSTSSAKFSVRSVYEGYRPRHLSVEGSANGSASSANAGFTVQVRRVFLHILLLLLLYYAVGIVNVHFNILTSRSRSDSNSSSPALVCL